MNFSRFEVIESVLAEQAGDPIQVRRSWRARLLTWPWRPWVRTRTVIPRVPAIFQLTDRLIVHPSLMPALREAFPPTGAPVRYEAKDRS